MIDGENDFFTKDLGRRIAFAANLCGCALPGKPLVESTSDLHSFTVLASLWQTDKYAAYLKSCRLLVEKLRTFAPAQITRPKLLAVHAGNHKTSNSLSLWQLTAAALAGKQTSQRSPSAMVRSGTAAAANTRTVCISASRAIASTAAS